MAEFAKPLVKAVVEERNMDGKSVKTISISGPPCWKVYVDGVANQRASRVGLVLVSPEKTVIKKSLMLGFSATNNEAEYECCYKGWSWCRKMGKKQ